MKIEVNEGDIRIDKFLSGKTEYSRNKIQKMITEGVILVNDNTVASNYIVKKGDSISIGDLKEESCEIVPEDMDIDIVYEDDYLAIINKASGVVVHPAPGNYNHTLVNGLMKHFNYDGKKSIRPGIVHRLDKDTSGLMVVAKSDEMLEKLSSMIQQKKIERQYLALVWGVVKHDKGKIDAPIGRDINDRQKYMVTSVNSKDSVTHFRVLDRYKDASLLMCKLDTGRTHQIRVHMDYIGHPIVNDPVYGNRKIFNDFGQMLHSYSIRFMHPVTNEEIFYEVLPSDEFNSILDEFRSEEN